MKPLVNNIANHGQWTKSEEAFTDLFKGNSVRIEKILSSGQITPQGEWYDQIENEFILLIQGEASIEFENEETILLTAGDFCNILPHQKHRVNYTSTEPHCIWLAVFSID